MAFDGLPVLDGPTDPVEEETDDGWGLYLFWRYIAWRRRRGLPDADLDDGPTVVELVAELEELVGDLLIAARAGLITSPEAP